MNECPLFPRPLAVCPREIVPLHIFEERYRSMMRDCLAMQAGGGEACFVISFFDEGRVSGVGTVVRLLKVLKRYADGRMDIVTEGVERCEIEELQRPKPYRVTRLGPYRDDAEDWDEELATEAFNLHRDLLESFTGERPGESFYAGQSSLSFLLAASAGMPSPAKQRLLQARNENERLRQLIGYLRELHESVGRVRDAAQLVQGYWEARKQFT